MIDKPVGLGKVFLSHSSADKPFVRRLARRLEKEGFPVWLDEKELRVGDSLGQRIARAVQHATVVLLVVSPASVKSAWLRYELNLATSRMVKGECRVVPVVIGEVALPSEVAGLLYADFRQGSRLAMRSVITALKYERSRVVAMAPFYARVDRTVEEIFGGRGFVSVSKEYKTEDWECVTIPVPDGNGSDETDVYYDTVADYSRRAEMLTDAWLSEFRSVMARLGLRLGLVVSERPLGFEGTQRDSENPIVSLYSVAAERFGASEHFVFVGLAGVAEGLWTPALTRARGILVDRARRQLEEDGEIAKRLQAMH